MPEGFPLKCSILLTEPLKFGLEFFVGHGSSPAFVTIERNSEVAMGIICTALNPTRDKSTDAHDRVIDVLGKFITKGISDLVIAFTFEFGSSKNRAS